MQNGIEKPGPSFFLTRTAVVVLIVFRFPLHIKHRNFEVLHGSIMIYDDLFIFGLPPIADTNHIRVSPKSLLTR